eukprot:406551_1
MFRTPYTDNGFLCSLTVLRKQCTTLGLNLCNMISFCYHSFTLRLYVLTMLHSPHDEYDSFLCDLDTPQDTLASSALCASKLPVRSAMLLKWSQEAIEIERDFSPPCPCMAQYCHWIPCFCCCVVPRGTQRQWALAILHSQLYPFIYILIIGITITLFCYSLVQTSIHHVLKEVTFELWVVIVDTSCVGLIIFDVAVQIQSHHQRYWKSSKNVYDLCVVLLCVSYLPIYFYALEHAVVLSMLLSIRFLSSFMCVVMVYKHLLDRKSIRQSASKSYVDLRAATTGHIAYDATDDVTFDTRSDRTF